jgi:amidase
MMAITRRRFVGGGLATGAAAMGGAFSPLPRLMAVPPQQPSFLEATIPQLQALMNNGRLTSRELTGAYLNRMAALNPLLGAVIETNPNAIAIAVQRDRERRNGHLRGPLHGIPVLVKDNIATADNMQTTAGSLALVNSQVPADAPIVSRLRAAGAVILGKTNLSEWANFRGFAPFNGWSGRGGFTRNPYLLDFDPCGSSSGSAVAPAANLCAASVGTETDGSIV